jgi:hypothetical protein
MSLKKATISHRAIRKRPKIGLINGLTRRESGHTRDIIAVSACESECKHFYRSKPGFSCKAFDSIPKEIIDGKVEHNKILPGQKGRFVYERKR